MNKITRTSRAWNLLIASIATLLLLSASLSFAQGIAAHEAPDGFDKMLVYMGTGVFDPDDTDYEAPDGDVWHREIMGRSDAEIEQNRDEALAFFSERFGLDPDTQDGLEFTDFMLDPRMEYRAYVVSEETVPSEGWIVRDGGWRLEVTNPEGVTLGGEFEGTHVPEGAFFVFGEYNIEVPDGEPIIIHYESGSAIVPTEKGLMFICDLSHPEWGEGLAQGISSPHTLEDERRQANIRNVLTFSGHGDPAEVPGSTQ